jgi:hypothetical protein
MQAVQEDRIFDLQPLEPGPLPARPLISVLMSNYNYARYIGQAIESVLVQTYPLFELIICDDGSTDESCSVVRKYLTDARIQLLTKPNGGHATGLNTAFEAAQGDIVCFLDADDLYMPAKLAVVVDNMRRHPDCAVLANASLRADDALRPQGRTPLFAALPSGWRGPEVVRAGGLLPYMPSTPGLNLRRPLAQLLFPLPVSRPLNAFPDMVLSKLAPLFSRIVSVDEPLAVIRLHSSNTYQRPQLSAESLGRELAISQRVWEVQRERLHSVNSAAARALAPLDSAPCILLQRFVAARLAGQPEWRAHAQRWSNHLSSHGNPLWQRAFWSGTALLPRSCFRRVMNLALNQSSAKELLWTMQNLVRLRLKSAQGPE